MRRGFFLIYQAFLHIFAVAGLVLVGGFFAVRFHLTDVKGGVDPRNGEYQQPIVLGTETDQAVVSSGSSDSFAQLDRRLAELSRKRSLRARNLCGIGILGGYAPASARSVLGALDMTDSDQVTAKMLLAAKIRLEESGHPDPFGSCDDGSANVSDESVLRSLYGNASGASLFPWMNDKEWSTIRSAIVKDRDAIDRAASAAGIEPRLLVSCAIVEQLRLFHSQRELFEKVFEPLKILGNANKISLGVMGIKDAAAAETEAHLSDPSSPYYLGPEYRNLLDYPAGADVSSARYARLTEDGDHYYSYLYGALYLRQMLEQWKKAGYDIVYRPEIAVTLFNVGFPQSKPNADPKVGGSSISVGDASYSFGSLGYEFYYSGELLDAFPYVVN